MSNTEPATVQFDVGGTLYRVSRSALEQRHPDTVLAEMVSTIPLNQDKPHFIDRNGERFQYVLDYIRDGHVNLPMNIPKAALLADLRFFGFQDVPADCINTSPGGILDCVECIHDFEEARNRKLELDKVAHHIYLNFKKTKSLSWEFSQQPPSCPNKPENEVFAALNCFIPQRIRTPQTNENYWSDVAKNIADLEVLNQALSLYELKFVSFGPWYSRYKLEVEKL